MAKYLLDVRRSGHRYIKRMIFDTEIGLYFDEDTSFFPRFICDVKPKAMDEGAWYRLNPFWDERRNEEIDPGYVKFVKSFRNDLMTGKTIECYEVLCTTSWNVPGISKQFQLKLNAWTHEDDIPYEHVYLLANDYNLVTREKDILKVIETCMEITKKLNVVAYDIETADLIGKKDILSMVFNNGKNEVFLDGDEEDILTKGWQEIKKAHVLHGYNCNAFDAPRIIARCELYTNNKDVQMLKNAFVRRVAGKTMEDGVFQGQQYLYDLAHGFHVDWYPLIVKQLIVKFKLEDNKLQTAVKELFGFEHTMKEMQKMVGKISREELKQYALMDGHAQDLFRQYLPFLFMFSALSNVPISKIGQSSLGTLSEHYIRKRLRNMDSHALIYKRVKKVGSEARIKGAEVFRAVGGVNDDCTGTDFKSQYPTVVQKYNISPETVGSVGTSNACGHQDCPIYNFRESWDARRKIDEHVDYEFRIQVCNKKRGLLPTLVKELVDLSETLKKHVKNLQKENAPADLQKTYQSAYDALKSYRNTIAYGYVIAPVSMMMSEDCARMILWGGRTAVKASMDYFDNNQELVRQYGVNFFEVVHEVINDKVVSDWHSDWLKGSTYRKHVLEVKHVQRMSRTRGLYGDTDSAVGKHVTDEEVKKIEEITNMPLEVEWRGIFIQKPDVKKKYIVVQTSKHDLKIRGIAYRRSDRCKFITEWQKHWLEELKKCNTFEDITNCIADIKFDEKYMLNIGMFDLPIEKFILKKPLNLTSTQNNPQNRVRDMLKEKIDSMLEDEDSDIEDFKLEYVYIYKTEALKTKLTLVVDALPVEMFNEKKYCLAWEKYKELFSSACCDLYGESEGLIDKMRMQLRRRGIRILHDKLGNVDDLEFDMDGAFCKRHGINAKEIREEVAKEMEEQGVSLYSGDDGEDDEITLETKQQVTKDEQA